jgi:hypothetical protein
MVAGISTFEPDGVTEVTVGGVTSGDALSLDEHPAIIIASRTADPSRNNFFINHSSFQGIFYIENNLTLLLFAIAVVYMNFNHGYKPPSKLPSIISMLMQDSSTNKF